MGVRFEHEKKESRNYNAKSRDYRRRKGFCKSSCQKQRTLNAMVDSFFDQKGIEKESSEEQLFRMKKNSSLT